VFQKLVASFGFRDEEGQDLVEYALLAGFVALVSTAIYTTLSTDISALWTAIATRLASTT
jgi:Flp pilus assembly pilin Flp